MERDLTTGNPTKVLLTFSIPLLFGTLFQQIYNLADTYIVGNLLGSNALAAVGQTGSITFFVLGLVFGACSGFAIPVAQDFGAKNEAGMRRCVANIIYIGVFFCIVITLLTTLLTRQILELLNTPEELMQDSYDYLVWIFGGIGSLMLYNLLASILRSLGDSRTPLIFLVIASLLNVVLDFQFIKNGMGVAGAAISTVIAQFVSGIACLIYMIAKYPVLHLSKADMKPHWPTIRRLLGIGLPMGLQFSITAIGSIIMQRAINGLGTVVVTSVAVAGKIQNLVAAPMDAFGVSIATYAGQNYGARKIDRVREGVKKVYMMLIICSVASFVLLYFASDFIALQFMKGPDPLVISQARKYLLYNALFYPALAGIYVLRNSLQGVGYSKAAMLSGAFELVARALMGVFIVPMFGFAAVCYSNPAAWILADVILIPLYIVLFKKLEPAMPQQSSAPQSLK